MNRNVITVLVLAVLAALCILSCGEKAMEPGSRPQMPAGGADMAQAALEAGRGHGLGHRHVKGTLLVASWGGIFAVSPEGDSFLFSPYGTSTSSIEVLGTRIFWLGARRIYEFDHLGNTLAAIDLPDRIHYGIHFTALPGGDFAIHDCEVDSVYFLDSSGTLLEAVAMPEASPLSLQNMRGLVIDGKLIISETGTQKIAQIDLETHAVSMFRDFSVPPSYMWFCNIEHQGRYYYIGRQRKLQRFTETGDLEDVVDFGDEYNLMGFAILRHKAYAALNFAGKIYEVNLSSGRAKCILEGLDYPVDVEFIPVVLKPPMP